VILPAYKGNWNKGWTKSGAIVPERIDGKYWMYWLGTAADKTDQMGLSWSTDLIHWTEATQTPVLPRRPGMFDSRVVEPGPPPILTPKGIVLIYNGADDDLVYRAAVAIFDRNDPRKTLYRSDTPIFAPEKEWEKVGQVPKRHLVEGMVPQKDCWFFYYGGADKYVGVAEAPGKVRLCGERCPCRDYFAILAINTEYGSIGNASVKPSAVCESPSAIRSASAH